MVPEEGWVEDPKAIWTIFAVLGLEVGDEIIAGHTWAEGWCHEHIRLLGRNPQGNWDILRLRDGNVGTATLKPDVVPFSVKAWRRPKKAG